jgi:acetyl-CoA synthetase
MSWPVVHKDPTRVQQPPNLQDYETVRAAFHWADARAHLEGLPDGAGLNIAHEAVDRHAVGPGGAHVAIRWLGKDGRSRDLTYGELRELTNRFANVLDHLGVHPGERVFLLLGRVPSLYVAALGTLKHRAVLSPLFSAFGPEPIRQRLELGDGRVLVTSRRLYERKVAAMRDQLPGLKHVLIVDAADELPPGTLDLGELLTHASPRYTIPPTDPEDPALVHFTSGTTGQPKGAVHVHEAIVAHTATARFALDLHPQDVFWCTADPGWVTGTSYGIIAPLALGVTMIVDEAEYDTARWYSILEEQAVTVWYTAPTAIRMLMKAGDEAREGRDLSALRFIASVGEPLNPAAVIWGEETFGLPIHDNWWQTETGGIMIANFAVSDIRPGSMGRPLPGIETAIVHRTGDDDHPGVEVVDQPDVEGELALRAGWPSMFRTYLGQPERYAKCFRDGWYLTGDLARRDAGGYLWFLGRSDDVIKSAGHLIGPTEVEATLTAHEAVVEAGVIGVPDPVAGEVVKAYVTLYPGIEATAALMKELHGFARKRLGPAVAPREIVVIDNLPKTRSGKIMRRLLKARELGLPEGDLSTLEGPTDTAAATPVGGPDDAVDQGAPGGASEDGSTGALGAAAATAEQEVGR